MNNSIASTRVVSRGGKAEEDDAYAYAAKAHRPPEKMQYTHPRARSKLLISFLILKISIARSSSSFAAATSSASEDILSWLRG